MEEKEKFDFAKALSKHDKDDNYKRLIQIYSTRSFFDIIGKGRSETMHSAFIAWLLGTKELVSSTGELSPLRSFLDLLLSRCDQVQDSQVRSDIMSALLSKSINNVEIETEKALKIQENKSSVTDKADVFITFEVGKEKYLILIENKVGSVEEGPKEKNDNPKGVIESYKSKTQTDRYHAILTNENWEKNSFPYKEYENHQKIFVFLTPFYDEENEYPEKGREVANNKYFININYQDLLDYCILPFVKSTYISDKNRFFLEEYIKCLSLSTVNEKSTKNYIVMASTADEKEELKNYYGENKPLILYAVAVSAATKVSIDGLDMHSEEIKKNSGNLKLFYERNKDLIMVALKECNPDVYDTLFRDNTKFCFTNENDNPIDDKWYGKGQFYYECVKKYVNQKKDVGIKGIENEFNHNIGDNTEGSDYPRNRLNIVYGKEEDGKIIICESSSYKQEEDNVVCRDSKSIIRSYPLDLNQKQKRYYQEPIKVNPEDECGFFVTTQWGDGNFHTFWKWAKDNIGSIKSNNVKVYPNDKNNLI